MIVTPRKSVYPNSRILSGGEDWKLQQQRDAMHASPVLPLTPSPGPGPSLYWDDLLTWQDSNTWSD